MPKCFIALQTGLVLACAIGNAQTNSEATKLPYTARYTFTTVKVLPNGSSSTVVDTMLQALDSKGHFVTIYTPDSSGTGGQKSTRVQVRDAINLTSSSWAVPGTTAQVVHMPDLGDPNNDCAKKMKAIDALHPVSAESSRGEVIPIKDLGTKMIRGLEAHGGEITFTSTFIRPGSSAPATRTNEVWTAVDPRLDKLVVLTTSTTSQGESSRQELVEFTKGEPDPKLFEIPADRQITKREGQAYICGIKPQSKPVTTQ